MQKSFNSIHILFFIAGGTLFFFDGLSLKQGGLTLILAIFLGLMTNYLMSRTIQLYKIVSILSSFILAHYVGICLTAPTSMSYLFFLIPITLAFLTFHNLGGLSTYGATLLFLFLQFLSYQNFTLLMEKVLIITLFSIIFTYFIQQKETLYGQNETWLVNLHRKINELSLLREVTLTMQKPSEQKNIDKNLLTAITAGYGLGFNRAVLFLEHGGTLQGQYAIGPVNKKEAYRIWGSVVTEKANLIQVMKNQDAMDDNLMNRILNIKLDLIKDQNHPVVTCFLEQNCLLSSKENLKNFDPLMEELEFEDYGLVPLVSSGKCLGVILVDNRFNEKTITEEDMDSLMILASQSALAFENIRLYEEISTLAITDELTKLFNHRQFKTQITAHLSHQLPFILMIIDVDDFKQFNENFGHRMGDLVLSKVGEALIKATQEEGLAFRYGGDEFALIFPDLSLDQALRKVDLIHSLVNEAKKTLVRHNLTVSIGLSSYPQDGTDITRLFIKADQNMKQAKETRKRSKSSEVSL